MSCNQIVDEARPLVSVVIPTKNRATYARWTIQSCVRLGQQCEIVVADSSSDDQLLDALISFDLYDKIVYVRTSPDFSVVDNFNAAVERTAGEYVICIGDDDIVTAALIEVAEYAKSANVECISFTFPVTYWWPDFSHRRRGSHDAGTLSATSFTGLGRRLDARRELNVAADKIGSGPQNMPRIYAGLVSQALIMRIREKYQNLFGGVSPDVYSSTLLASECRSMVHLDYPVVVPGLSGGSTSGTSSNGTHLGKLRENSHIAPFKNLVWDSRIPEFYSVPTVWSFSMLKALEVTSQDHKANFLGVYVKCLLYTRGYSAEVWPLVKKYLADRTIFEIFADLGLSLSNEIGYVSGAIKRRLGERFMKTEYVRYSGFSDSMMASVKVDELVSLKPFTLPVAPD